MTTRIEIWKDDELLMCVPGNQVPKGAILRECYETENEIVVCGMPNYDDETHNCDMMGCSSVNHVLYRFKK